jgi:hypothetical protein
MSRYEHLKTKNKKSLKPKMTSTQKRFLMAIIFVLLLFLMQLVAYLKQ